MFVQLFTSAYSTQYRVLRLGLLVVSIVAALYCVWSVFHGVQGVLGAAVLSLDLAWRFEHTNSGLRGHFADAAAVSALGGGALDGRCGRLCRVSRAQTEAYYIQALQPTPF